MDGSRFDDLTRRFAAKPTRRALLKGLLSTAIAGPGALLGRSLTSRAQDDPTVTPIESEPTATPTIEPSATPTSEPSATPTATVTPVSTETPAPTETAVPTESSTAEATATTEPTETATATSTPEPTATSAPEEVLGSASTTDALGWPFRTADGQWAVISGYHNGGSHGNNGFGQAETALDLAICPPSDIDWTDKTCAFEEDWQVLTYGKAVLAPVTGTITYGSAATAECPGLAITVDASPNYRVFVYHVQLGQQIKDDINYLSGGTFTPSSWRDVETWRHPVTNQPYTVSKGSQLGIVSDETCVPGTVGNHIHMELRYWPPNQGGPTTPIPFANDWPIGTCSYPDNDIPNQHKGKLVPCWVQPPTKPVIGGVNVSGVAETSATISWLTDVDATGWVKYGTASGALNLTAPVQPFPVGRVFNIELENLKPGTTYYYKIYSRNSVSTAATREATFTTKALAKPTIVSGPRVYVTSVAAEITWTTDLPTNSRVDYGLTSRYGKSSKIEGRRTSHSVAIKDLSRGTLYNFRVRSANEGGAVYSPNRTLKTFRSGPTASSLRSGTTISWTTADRMSSRVLYWNKDEGSSFSSVRLNGTRTSHQVTLPNLSPGTEYSYRVESADSRRTLTSIFRSFTTLALPDSYQFVTQWGSWGSGDGQLGGPLGGSFGIAVDNTGNIFVTDYGNRRVQKFTDTGVFLGKWGSEGDGDGQFRNPHGIAVDGGGVYVNDHAQSRIQKFTSVGSYVTQWREGGDNEGLLPDGVAVDRAGRVYVTSTISRVQVFTSDGTFLHKWGQRGSGDGEFESGLDVAVDAEGNVYVADTYNHRVQKFTNAGVFLGKWGSQGASNGQFDRPAGIAVDGIGGVYVTDAGNHRIQKFTSEGTYIGQWGSRGSGDGQFEVPYAIAVDSSGNVFVTDVYNYRIQKFAPAGT